MTGGNKIVGLFGEPVHAAPAPETPLEPDPFEEAPMPFVDENAARPSPVAPVLFWGIALLWVGFVIVAAIDRYGGRAPGLAELGGLISTAAAPLALIGVLYLLLGQRNRRLARGFTADAASIERSADAIEGRMAMLTQQADSLTLIAADAAMRLDEAAARLGTSLGAVEARGSALAGATGEADRRLQSLLAGLPRADANARAVTASLEEANLAAVDGVEALGARLDELGGLTAALEATLRTAAAEIGTEAGRIDAAGLSAADRVTAAARAMGETADAALERASAAMEATRGGLDAQAGALAAMAETAGAAIARTADEQGGRLAARVAAINADVELLAGRLDAQDAIGAALVARLAGGLDQVERLGASLAGLADRADVAAGAIANGASLAETTIARSEALLLALDAATREIDETLPAALARMDAATDASRARLDGIGPTIGDAADRGQALAGALADADALVAAQRERLDTLAGLARQADADARALVDGSGPALVDMMVRVREASTSAADRARETIGRVVPELAQALAAVGDEALGPALAERVEAGVAAIGEAARRAAAAADEAVGTLTARAADADAAVERLDRRLSLGEGGEAGRDSFAARVSKIIEGLHASSIDIATILSGTAGDAEWEAYRAGNHAAFTRRATELVGGSEARDLDLRVAGNPALREAVNRFVHDFEAMLRSVVSTREGAALGVTLLSSDIGKLYAALVRALDSRG